MFGKMWQWSNDFSFARTEEVWYGHVEPQNISVILEKYLVSGLLVQEMLDFNLNLVK